MLPTSACTSILCNKKSNLNKFTNITIVASSNAARIKSSFNTTGYFANITYSNIVLQDIDAYGIDLQQDYLNGGPKGNPPNGIIFEDILFQNITGTVSGNDSTAYLCALR
jgi:polygalacturonase